MINFCRVSYFCLGMGINLSDSDVNSLDLIPIVMPFDGDVLFLCLLLSLWARSMYKAWSLYMFMVEREVYLTLYVVGC
jgi:hypothetical protein